MGKIKLNHAFTAISGKLCGTESQYYATNKQNGQVYTASLCNPYTGPRSEKQKAVSDAFVAKSKIVAKWFADNKPSDSQPKGTAIYQQVVSAFKSQHTYGNIRAFVSKKMSADGTLTIGSSTTDIIPTPPPANNDDGGSL